MDRVNAPLLQYVRDFRNDGAKPARLPFEPLIPLVQDPNCEPPAPRQRPAPFLVPSKRKRRK